MLLGVSAGNPGGRGTRRLGLPHFPKRLHRIFDGYGVSKLQAPRLELADWAQRKRVEVFYVDRPTTRTLASAHLGHPCGCAHLYCRRRAAFDRRSDRAGGTRGHPRVSRHGVGGGAGLRREAPGMGSSPRLERRASLLASPRVSAQPQADATAVLASLATGDGGVAGRAARRVDRPPPARSRRRKGSGRSRAGQRRDGLPSRRPARGPP